MRIAALLLAVSVSAHAEFKDGNELLADIQSGTYYTQGIALGYIMGVADMGLGIVHCAPPTVKAGQLNDMIRNHLISFPAIRHLAADALISSLLKSTWPCPKGRPS